MSNGILSIDREDTRPDAEVFDELGMTKEDIDTRLSLLEADRNVFANLYEDSAGTAISLVTSGTYYQWVSSTRGEESGSPKIHTNISDDNIVIGKEGSGFYYVDISASFSGSNNSGIHGTVFVNNVKVSQVEFHRKLSGNDLGNACGSGILRLVPGSIIDLRFSSDTNATTLTVEHVHLTVFRLRAENLI